MHAESDIKYIGVNDYEVELFESLYKVPNGMAYNSYVILDEKIAIMDTVEEEFKEQWLANMEQVLQGRVPDYLIVQHMEPDHSANILNVLQKYPETILVASAKAFEMMHNFFGTDFEKQRIIVTDGDRLLLGKHMLTFVTAPMVHWPEVIMTYDETEKVLFSADGFGTFGANKEQNDMPVSIEPKDWVCEARRYYFGIIGKYGFQVSKLLEKMVDWDIRMICPLHGPVLWEHIDFYMNLYQTWASYTPEEEGIVIAYTSVYGNTKKAALFLETELKQQGYNKVILKNLVTCDMSEAVEDAFRYSKIVLATTMFNAELFPAMREFISCLKERNFCNRKMAFIENGSWSCIAARLMQENFSKSKNMTFMETTVKLTSVLSKESMEQIKQLAKELIEA